MLTRLYFLPYLVWATYLSLVSISHMITCLLSFTFPLFTSEPALDDFRHHIVKAEAKGLFIFSTIHGLSLNPVIPLGHSRYTYAFFLPWHNLLYVLLFVIIIIIILVKVLTLEILTFSVCFLISSMVYWLINPFSIILCSLKVCFISSCLT